jgi:hypothetical protein
MTRAFKSKLSIVVFAVKYVRIEVENTINEVRKKIFHVESTIIKLVDFVEGKLSAIV